MGRLVFFLFLILFLFQLTQIIALSSASLAQEWEFRKPRGTLKVVDLFHPEVSVLFNCAEGLVSMDKDNRLEPCLAKDWRWMDERTIEFQLRQDVAFHNGEKFNAEAVRVNWEEYKRMAMPRPHRWICLPDETIFEIIDDYTVRFTLPEPD